MLEHLHSTIASRCLCAARTPCFHPTISTVHPLPVEPADLPLWEFPQWCYRNMREHVGRSELPETRSQMRCFDVGLQGRAVPPRSIPASFSFVHVLASSAFPRPHCPAGVLTGFIVLDAMFSKRLGGWPDHPDTLSCTGLHGEAGVMQPRPVVSQEPPSAQSNPSLVLVPSRRRWALVHHTRSAVWAFRRELCLCPSVSTHEVAVSASKSICLVPRPCVREVRSYAEVSSSTSPTNGTLVRTCLLEGESR